MNLTLDTKSFARDMQEVLRLRKTSTVKVLNRAGRNIAFRAQKLTPKATAGRIRKDLGRRVEWAGAKVRHSKRGRVLKGRKTKLIYLLAMKAAREAGQTGKLTQPEIVSIITKFGKKRMSSRNYIATGWFKVAADFGASVRRYSTKGLAGKSRGVKATINKPVAVLENAARGADKVGKAALQAAIYQVSAEMVAYAREEFAKSDAKLRK